MDQGAVGRADQDRRVAPRGILIDHEAGDVLVLDAPDLVGRDPLEIAAELVDLLPERGG
jgi:hypothetical protein